MRCFDCLDLAVDCKQKIFPLPLLGARALVAPAALGRFVSRLRMIAHAAPAHRTAPADVDCSSELTPQLRKTARKLARLLDRVRRDPGAVAVRWRIGARVLAVQNDPRNGYGRRGVKNLAEALGCGERCLYQHAFVARTWPLAELKRLMALVGPEGNSLTWSHVTALDRRGLTAEDRQQWLDDALFLNYDSREMLRLLKGARSRPGEHPLKAVLKRQELLRRQSELAAAALASALEQSPRLEDLRQALQNARRLRDLWDEAAQMLAAHFDATDGSPAAMPPPAMPPENQGDLDVGDCAYRMQNLPAT